MNEIDALIDETIRALEQMKRAGITHVDVRPETLAIPLTIPPTPASSALVASQPIRPADTETQLQQLAAEARRCTRCAELAQCRTQVVFGTGNPRAELMFIGEAPGADEDAQGEPFVGRAGQLLTKIIQAMGFARHEVYIANVLKCRPPENRTPLPMEVQNCLPYLQRQIELIQPRAMVALGATAMRALLDIQIGITKMRGRWYYYRGIPIMPTYHPAYLLRNPAAKREVWQDMQEVVRQLGREIPRRST
ncbi:MAG: uracil-DNA glycosylase [Verrucomicrobiae bacterium]|nr:uracil-DNA glycosylase [Verrucomicrobiae bacterium]